nr:MAG TPA: hypothetical protein [Caudoviricetes sp.]
MVKTKYQPICEKMCENYFDVLINKLYKILPLKEERSLTVDKYIESLLSELTGGQDVILLIHEDGQYLSVINSLEFIRTCESISVCRREIFKCIRIVEKLKQKYF